MNVSSDRKEIFLSFALVIAVAVIGLMSWEVVVWHFELPKALLPTPRQCFAAGIENRDVLLKGVVSTGIASLAGLSVSVALGSLLAMLFSQSRKMRLAFFP